jgi:hypothetical protein
MLSKVDLNKKYKFNCSRAFAPMCNNCRYVSKCREGTAAVKHNPFITKINLPSSLGNTKFNT